MRQLLIALVIAALALLSGCKHREAVHARVDGALAPLLPGDTVAIACLRLDRLKGTQFYANYVAGKQIKLLEEFAGKTGLDPRENIWELVFSTNGRTSYVFIRGKFGGEFGFEPDFKAPGLVRSDYKGHYLIYIGDSGVVYMNSGAAVAGRVDDLKHLVDGFDNPNRTSPQAILDLVDTLPGASHFWAASTAPGSLIGLAGTPGSAAGLAGNLARMGRRITHATLWGNLSQGLEIHVSATVGSDSEAAEMRDVLRAAVQMGRLSAENSQPEMLRLYDGVNAVSEGRAVRVEIREPPELLDSLMAGLGQIGSSAIK